MRLFYVALLCIVSLSDVIAQKPTLSNDFSLEISERYTEIKSINTYNFVYNNKILLAKKNKDHLTLQRFDLSGLKKSSEKSQIVEDKGDFVNIVQMEDYVFAFYAVRNRLYVQKISILSRVVQPPKLLVNSKSAVANNFGFTSTYNFNSEGKIHKFAIKKGFDNKQFLVQYLLAPGLLADKRTKDIVVAAIYDSSLKEISKQQITLPYPSNRIEKVDFAVDSESNHYMSIKVYQEATETPADIEPELKPYHVEILKTAKNTGSAVSHKVEMNDAKVLDEMVFHPDRSDQMHMIGLFKDNYNELQVAGVADLTVATDGNLENRKFSSIPDTTRTRFDTERQTRIDNGSQDKEDLYDLQNLKINEVKFESDGSLTVFTEQRYVTEKYMTTATGIKPKYMYHYRNMYVFSMSEGELQWFQRMPKHQVGIRGKQSLSYISGKGGGNYYVLFLDNFKNLRLPLDAFPYQFFEGKGGYLYIVAYRINQETGDTDKVAVINTKDIKGLKMNRFYTDKIVKIDERNMVIEAYDNKKKNFLLKLSIKN